MLKECAACGVNFEARNSRQKTCSITCGRHMMHARLRKERGTPRTCAHCGTEWIAMPKDKSKFCSWECHAADKNHGPTHVVECEECGASKYDTEHRIVAARAIGRPVETHEIVIHLDRDKLNNAPENLYIFGSRSDWVRVQLGPASSWPAKSNLDIWERSNPPTRLE